MRPSTSLHAIASPVQSQSPHTDCAAKLFRVDLSDVFSVEPPKRDTDIHQMLITVNQMPKGETNHGQALWGRGTRPKNPVWCAVGSLGFCLMCRFDATSKFADMTVEDWMNNQSWFDTKLLIDVSGG